MADAFQRLGALKDVGAFRARVASLGLRLPIDPGILSAADGSPLAQPLQVGPFTVGNRWCVHPMEGWDGTADGNPTEHTLRRWRRFGLSGAKLIWGGEAFAVQHDGRANPNQLFHRPGNEAALRGLLETLRAAHRERFGPDAADNLLVGLQLTHSGRFCRPNDKTRLEPRIAYHHPLLDARVGIRPDDDSIVVHDDYLKALVDRFVEVARVAQRLGFHFVDIKHCHGYLGHELLSAFDRPGPYGGDLTGRTRFLRQIVQGIRASCPGLLIGVRLSAFDTVPYHPDPTRSAADRLGPGVPDAYDAAESGPYPGFGCDRADPLRIDLTEPMALLRLLRDELQVELVNLTAGSPYYNPHIQRPACFPPSDGYQPPEDPLAGCARQIDVVRQLKLAVPGLPMVGTAYTYFQEFLPLVAQAAIREGWVDSVGIGRMVLTYPGVCADCLEAGRLRTPKLICRTFSDCTTAPRNGLISGCFPLDDHYKASAVAEDLKRAKHELRERLRVLHSRTGPV